MYDVNKARETTKKSRARIIKREIRWMEYQIKQKSKNGLSEYRTIYDVKLSDEERLSIAKYFSHLDYDVNLDSTRYDIIISWKNKGKEQ